METRVGPAKKQWSSKMGHHPGSARWGTILAPPRGTHSPISEFSSRNQGPTQLGDGNFRLSMEHRPITSSPTNENKVTGSSALTLNFAFENFSLKTIRVQVFENQPPVLLSQPCNQSFSAPDSDTSVCLASQRCFCNTILILWVAIAFSVSY